ncbi:TIGR02391 family protein [Paenarthrobacter aurescens]|nr:TIGR02391 family protein [Paenarthrobacter aurescens]MDO6143350.1 TIGR02391 family protein [Paenarthrobacter aurescens]MDO6147198.1 TIGR02391 family protein [Paenarthrobacter aurescens]MDO6158442.1 TIGR02391 family protein [Paenarthrobacter aurescens]MDO6162426.1 TIGR02391 family protein [Paenarthrobacter aurescens]
MLTELGGVMESRTNSDYLEFLGDRLDKFSSTFEEFMTHHVENTGFGGIAVGMAPAVLPKDGADKARVRALTDQLNHLAGALMDLSNVTQVRMTAPGAGVLDPFVNWQRMLEPKPLLDAGVVRSCCLQAAGRLEGLQAKAAALSSPNIEPSLLHPLVWAAAQRLWNDGHLRQAVAASAEAVSGQMKQLIGRNNASDTSLWQQAFAAADPQEGKPRLRWPGDVDDQDVKTMQSGLLSFAPGVNMVIRNPATHVSADFTEQDGLEQLATLSILAKFLDRCVVVSVDGVTSAAVPPEVPAPADESNRLTTREDG